MKIQILLIALLATSLTVKSQSLADLDTKNGFKNFKLNSSINLHKAKLEYSSKDYKNIVAYKLKGELPLVHGNLPTSIILDYYKSYLFRLSFYFKDYKGVSFKTTSSNIELLYGQPTDFRTTMTGNFYVEWKSKSVVLSMQYFKNDDTYVLEYKSLPLDRKILLDNN